jgi:hypothetical protein
METNFSSRPPRATAHPYRGSEAPCERAPRTGDTSLTGPILWVTGLLCGFCLLRVGYGFHSEGWNLERWTALGIALWLARSAWRQVRGSHV